MTTAELIGRDHPAGVLRAEIDRAAESHGGLVLVTGEAGIGKTTLVTDGMDAARRAGALVLSGSCWDSTAAPGYWPWVQVIRALRRHGEGQPRASRCCLGERGPAAPADRVPDLRRGHQRAGRGGAAAAGRGGARRPALGRPGVRAAAGVRRAAHLVRAAAAGRHVPRRGGRGHRPPAGAADAAAAGPGHHDHADRPRPRGGRRADRPHDGRPAGRRPGRRGAPAHRRQPVLRRADGPAVAQRQRADGRRAGRAGRGAPPALAAAGPGVGAAHRRVGARPGVPPPGARGRRRGTHGGGRPAAGRGRRRAAGVRAGRRPVRVRPRPGARDAVRVARRGRRAAPARGGRPRARPVRRAGRADLPGRPRAARLPRGRPSWRRAWSSTC